MGDTTYRRFPKLGLVVDTRTHLILSFAAGTGPGSDHPHFDDCLYHARRRASVRKVAADAGYDSEANHRLARLDLGVRTVIPPLIGRPTAKPPSGRWRRVMRRLTGSKAARQRSGYSQRWQAETVNSMMKRNQGSALRARTHHTRNRELALRVLTHDLAVLRRGSQQSRTGSVPLSEPVPLSHLSRFPTCPAFPPVQRARNPVQRARCPIQRARCRVQRRDAPSKGRESISKGRKRNRPWRMERRMASGYP